jgi:uncharacterized protein
MYYGMRFEWDAEKNRVNQNRHAGLDFHIASGVFEDPNLMLIEDRVVDGEQRWRAIGAIVVPTEWAALLVVVHVYRKDNTNGEEIIRIISAREASQRERRIYFQQASD